MLNKTAKKIWKEMSNQDEKLNENLECLLEHGFPKGDKRRGDALVIVAQAQIEIDKAREQGIEIGLKRCISCKAEQYKQGRADGFHAGFEQGIKDGKIEESIWWKENCVKCNRQFLKEKNEARQQGIVIGKKQSIELEKQTADLYYEQGIGMEHKKLIEAEKIIKLQAQKLNTESDEAFENGIKLGAEAERKRILEMIENMIFYMQTTGTEAKHVILQKLTNSEA